MKRCVTTILLMLSLEALGRLSAAVADDVGIIRLPSDGKGLADQVTAAMKKGDEERPWKCCNLAICTRSFPPTCRCLDMVEQCASACKLCEAVESDPSRYTCQDWYHGDPGPRCTEEGNEDVVVVRGAAGGAAGEVIMAAATKARDHDEERPWKCCDVAICTMSLPPICRCTDIVEQCAGACKECEQVYTDMSWNPDRYRCLDKYFGDPGPSCAKHVGGQKQGRRRVRGGN